MTWGCESTPVGKSSDTTQDTTGASEADLQSPNARIFPEPLEGESRTLRESGESDLPETAIVAVREKARPFPLHQELSPDGLERGTGAGVELLFQFVWPETKKTVQLGAQEVSVWPQLRVQLLRETPARPARMRWLIEGVGLPFPEGTEIRARADRIGHAIVWPDQRSYRVAPPGSLHALFADRRVDRVPFVEAGKVEIGSGSRLGKPTIKRSFSSPLGKISLESMEARELPYASELLCYSLLEIARIKGSADLCPEGELAVHFEVAWQSEHRLTLTAVSSGPSASFNLDLFRVPPDLPIFKRGELPPFDEFFFSRDEREALFPFTDKIAAPHSAAPPGLVPSPGLDVTPVSLPPRNQLLLKNNLHRPVVIMVNKVPFKWLAAKTEMSLYLASPDVRVSARDVVGEKVFAERVLLAPASWELGESAELSPPVEAPAQP
jgi:hypothetical protein